MLGAEIAERRADPREDILSLLVPPASRTASRWTTPEIRDQLMTLLLAGHETTATGLAWTFDLLLRHPRVLARLVAEVEAGEDAYLRAVVSESLRLRPVVPLAGRRLSQELRVNGHVLPPGTDVTPAIWLAHTRPDRYPEPYAFRPERFLDDAPATYAWLPFGGGVRRCIGAAFAEMEMRVALGGDPAAADAAARVRPGRAGRAAQRHVLAADRNPGLRRGFPLASGCHERRSEHGHVPLIRGRRGALVRARPHRGGAGGPRAARVPDRDAPRRRRSGSTPRPARTSSTRCCSRTPAARQLRAHGGAVRRRRPRRQAHVQARRLGAAGCRPSCGRCARSLPTGRCASAAGGSRPSRTRAR